MYRGPSPEKTVFVGDMITLGSIFSRAFSRSFIAYLAKSVLLSYWDWAKAFPPITATTQTDRTSDSLMVN
jgi:hypothetical protein